MFKGLQSLWGGFGEAVLRYASQTVDALRTAFGLAREGGAPVDVPVLRQELSYIRREGEAAPYVAALGVNETIPENLYVESDIPWKQPFAYEVSIFGRDIATGEYTRTERIVTSSSELTPGEAIEIVSDRFGADGAYPQLYIEDMALTGAFTRAGEIPF